MINHLLILFCLFYALPAILCHWQWELDGRQKNDFSKSFIPVFNIFLGLFSIPLIIGYYFPDMESEDPQKPLRDMLDEIKWEMEHGEHISKRMPKYATDFIDNSDEDIKKNFQEYVDAMELARKLTLDSINPKKNGR